MIGEQCSRKDPQLPPPPERNSIKVAKRCRAALTDDQGLIG
jgi:hypothetical protein